MGPPDAIIPVLKPDGPDIESPRLEKELEPRKPELEPVPLGSTLLAVKAAKKMPTPVGKSPCQSVRGQLTTYPRQI